MTPSPLRSSLLSIPHGFATRHGGISQAPHLSSLNLGYDLGDDDAVVDENRVRFFTAALGIRFSNTAVVSARQIHSSTVAFVTKSDLGRTNLALDALVTTETGLPLFIKTADCCPLLFHDPIACVIAAAHAGWRGSVNRIAQNTVSVMYRCGARPENIRCAIGPSIHACCYEVGEDFISAVNASLPPHLASLTLQYTKDGSVHADLIALNRALLIESGLSDAHIDILSRCTCCESDNFFSHRASKGKRGLGGGIIMLP